jgi:hypothetical protein
MSRLQCYRYWFAQACCLNLLGQADTLLIFLQFYKWNFIADLDSTSFLPGAESWVNLSYVRSWTWHAKQCLDSLKVDRENPVSSARANDVHF